MVLVRMIRHGRPAGDWGGGDEDPGLDAVGAGQARAVGDALLSLADPPRIVVSSPLRRCRETAEALARALGAPVLIDPRVGEIPTPPGLGPAERRPWLRQAMAGRWNEITGEADYAGWRAGVLQALSEHSGAAVFSHFVALNAAVTFVRGEEQVLGFRPAHASVTTFAIGPSGLGLVSLGAEMATEVL